MMKKLFYELVFFLFVSHSLNPFTFHPEEENNIQIIIKISAYTYINFPSSIKKSEEAESLP